jgi:hypothetical protein
MSTVESRGIYGLVEPTSRRYIHQELDLGDYFVGGYTEYQLRSDFGRGAADNLEDDDDESVDEDDRGHEADGDVGTVLSLLRDYPETVGYMFLAFLCAHQSDVLVLWLSGGEFLTCQGPDARGTDHIGSLPSLLEQMDVHGVFCAHVTFRFRRHRIKVARSTREGSGLDWSAALLKLFARVDAVSAIEFDARLSARDLRDVVSRAPPWGRTLDFGADDIPVSTARILANCCHPKLTLVVHLDGWGSNVSVLAEAMLANQCPALLVLKNPDEPCPLLTEALRTTTCVEHVTLVWSYRTATSECFGEILDALGRNHAIRDDLVVKRRSGVVVVWRSVLTSRTLDSTDAADVEVADEHNCPDVDRRERTEVVVSMLGSNPAVTHLVYNRKTHDEEVMEKQARPLLHLNRFRPVVEALEGMRAAERERALSAILGSEVVCGRSYLLFRLVRSMIKDSLVAPPAFSHGGRKRSRSAAFCYCQRTDGSKKGVPVLAPAAVEL